MPRFGMLLLVMCRLVCTLIAGSTASFGSIFGGLEGGTIGVGENLGSLPCVTGAMSCAPPPPPIGLGATIFNGGCGGGTSKLIVLTFGGAATTLRITCALIQKISRKMSACTPAAVATLFGSRLTSIGFATAMGFDSSTRGGSFSGKNASRKFCTRDANGP